MIWQWQKKNPVKLLDRDKTKNKHYEQTLIFWRIFEVKKKKKSPPIRPGAT